MRRVAHIFWLAGLIILTGCTGYRLGPVSQADYHTVAVPMFKNRTLKPQLEAQITNAIIKRFQSDGTLRVTHETAADVLLSGEIIRYGRRDLRALRDDTQVPREYRIEIEVQLQARDRRTGQVILEKVEVVGTADALIGSDLQSAEQQALPLCADDIARKAVRLLAESW